MERIISQITAHDKQGEAAEMFAKLQNGPKGEQALLWKGVPLWLEHTERNSPLVPMLAKSEKPELRLMVMGAIKTLPTARHQEMLAQLVGDPDPTVRAAAEEVSEQLKVIAAEKPARYASDVAEEDEGGAK